MEKTLVLIKGAGDLATGVAWRLKNCGFSVVCTEIAAPTAVRRTVSFCQAVYDGTYTVEGVTARLCTSPQEAAQVAKGEEVAVLVDPACVCLAQLRPAVLIDAILAKRNTGTKITDAPRVIALGPGFTAGVDCHCVIETKRGHTLGRCIWQGAAIPNTGVPGNVGGYTTERLLKTPCAGVFRACSRIGDLVTAGQIVAQVDGTPVVAQITGYLRGLLQDGLSVPAGLKAGDIDARCEEFHCYTISDKSLAIAGGCLEAVLHPPLPKEPPVCYTNLNQSHPKQDEKET
jgi:xanthine dehydrogenase accessory factor